MKNKWNKKLRTPSLYLCSYNCYRTVRHPLEDVKEGCAAFILRHCPVTVVAARYRDGVHSFLFPLFFVICHPYLKYYHTYNTSLFNGVGCAG